MPPFGVYGAARADPVDEPPTAAALGGRLRAMPAPRVRLRPGIRVCERGDGAVQLGLHPGHRLVLADDPTSRGALALLASGVEPARLDPELLHRLMAARLLTDPGTRRSSARERVAVVATDEVRAPLVRLLSEAGIRESARTTPAVTIVVTIGAEPRREEIDALVQADRPHLVLTAVAGRLRIGPFVVPGLTACLRCLDAHLTDRDARHPLVVEQHLVPDPADRPSPGDLQLALAWAARDVARMLDGDRPTTWSATVDLEPTGPVTSSWRRHPGCGCAWGDALTG